MTESVEQRVAELERKVEVLTEALVAATKLSNQDPAVTYPKAQPELRGTGRIAEVLRQGGLL